MAKLTTEEFIKKARAVHGDKYDYSKVEYVNSTTKVCIICKVHGEFLQTPGSHMKGHGCAKCASEVNAAKMRLWTEEKCYEEASRYSEMKSFRTHSKDVYNAALKHHWLKNYTWLSYKIDVSKPKKTVPVFCSSKVDVGSDTSKSARFSMEIVMLKDFFLSSLSLYVVSHVAFVAN